MTSKKTEFTGLRSQIYDEIDEVLNSGVMTAQQMLDEVICGMSVDDLSDHWDDLKRNWELDLGGRNWEQLKQAAVVGGLAQKSERNI